MILVEGSDQSVQFSQVFRPFFRMYVFEYVTKKFSIIAEATLVGQAEKVTEVPSLRLMLGFQNFVLMY